MGVRLPSRGFAHDQLVIGGQTHGCVVGFDAHGAGAVGGRWVPVVPPTASSHMVAVCCRSVEDVAGQRFPGSSSQFDSQKVKEPYRLSSSAGKRRRKSAPFPSTSERNSRAGKVPGDGGYVLWRNHVSVGRRRTGSSPGNVTVPPRLIEMPRNPIKPCSGRIHSLTRRRSRAAS